LATTLSATLRCTLWTLTAHLGHSAALSTTGHSAALSHARNITGLTGTRGFSLSVVTGAYGNDKITL
jgi:hypothetical protein